MEVLPVSVEKVWWSFFVEGITLEPYLLLVQLVLVRVERVNMTNFVFGVRTLSGYLAHAQAMSFFPHTKGPGYEAKFKSVPNTPSVVTIPDSPVKLLVSSQYQ